MTCRHRWRWECAGMPTVFCECGEAMEGDEMVRRLNDYERLKKATDYLSAEDAHNAAGFAWNMSHDAQKEADRTKGEYSVRCQHVAIDWDAIRHSLRKYAITLRGNDETA